MHLVDLQNFNKFLILIILHLTPISMRTNGPFGTGKLIFRGSPYTPMLECSMSDGKNDLEKAKGASVEFLKGKIFELIKATPYTIGLGGITITNERIQKSAFTNLNVLYIYLEYKFTFPTFKAGFSMVVKDQKLNTQFLTPLTYLFVSILFMTIFVTAIILYFVEGIDSIYEFIYSQISNLFFSGKLYAHLSGRIIIFPFICIIIIITESYIALIAEIFILHTRSRYAKADDLDQKYISANEYAHNILFALGAYVRVSEKLPNSNNIENFHSDLSISNTDGIVTDDPFANLIDKLFCDVHVELRDFFSADFGYIVGPKFPNFAINQLNQAILKVQTKYPNNYVDNYLYENYEEQFCKRKWKRTEIDTYELIELFYILLSFITLSVIINKLLGISRLSKYEPNELEENSVNKDISNKSCLNIKSDENEQKITKDIEDSNSSINSLSRIHEISTSCLNEEKEKPKTNHEINEQQIKQINSAVDQKYSSLHIFITKSIVDRYWKDIFNIPNREIDITQLNNTQVNTIHNV